MEIFSYFMSIVALLLAVVFITLYYSTKMNYRQRSMDALHGQLWRIIPTAICKHTMAASQAFPSGTIMDRRLRYLRARIISLTISLYLSYRFHHRPLPLSVG